MSVSPDPGAPRDPAEYRPRSLMGPSFWALIALCVLCVLAGAGVATLAPRYLANKPAPRAEPAPVSAIPAGQPFAQILAPPVTALAPPATPTGEIDRLNARIAALESQESRTSGAAVAALAAAALVEASQGSRPFPAELAALRTAAPEAPELAALSHLADAGAPSRAALAASFPDYAARAVSAGRTPAEGSGVGDRLIFAISKFVSLRRVGDVAGDSPDARLARAERALQDGDIQGGLKALDGLSPASREALAPWRARAERRAEIDRQAAALRARALRDLAPSRTGA